MTEMHIIALACAVALLIVFTFIWKHHITSAPVPVSVNYHFTRRCNYECGFCFHIAKTLYIMAISCDSFNEATNVKIGRRISKHLYYL
jgi:hypothetical protein